MSFAATLLWFLIIQGNATTNGKPAVHAFSSERECAQIASLLPEAHCEEIYYLTAPLGNESAAQPQPSATPPSGKTI